MTYVSGKMRLATGKDFDRYREKLKQEGVQVDDRGFITDESVFWNGFKEPQVAVKRVAGTSNEGNLAEAASRQDTDLVSNNLGLFGAAFVPHAPIDLETSDGDMTAANAGIRRHTGTKFGNGTAAMTNRLMGVWMVRG